MKSTLFQTVYAFLKKNAFSCVCLLLAILVCVTGTISYSKYVSGGAGGDAAGTGTFSVSASIDGVSALSFTNTAFWGGSAENDKIAMNALRTLNFSVNNFKKDAAGTVKVSDVKMKYILNFSAPKNFAEKLAIQPFDDKKEALLPQIVIADLISAGDNGVDYDTSKSNDYNGTVFADFVFKVTKNSASTYYTAKSGGFVISVEEFKKESEQTLLMRSWDTSGVTNEETPKLDNEAGKLQPPITVTYKATTDYYRISVACDDFVLPPASPVTKEYSLQLVPTDTIEDGHLGGFFMDVTKDSGGNVTDFSPIEEIYSDENKKWTIQTTRESVTDDYYADDTFSGTVLKTKTDEYGVMGNPKIYTIGSHDEEKTSSKKEVNETTAEGASTSTVTEEYVINAATATERETTTTNVEEAISWDKVDVTSGAPTSAWNYTRNALATAKNPTDGSEGTTYYIYKVTGEQKGTVTVKKTTTTETVVSKTVTDRQTDITESSFVQSVDSTQENVTLNVTKTTKVTDMGSTIVRTTTMVQTCTRTFTRTGEFYLGYYTQRSGWNSTLTFWDSATGSLVVDSDNNSDGIQKGDELSPRECVQETKARTSSDGAYTTVSESDPTQVTQSFVITSEPQTEYFTRVIKRNFVYSDIVISNVTWAKRDEHGNAIYDDNGVLQTESFNGDNKLSFYDDKGIQKVYLAQCYSKSYPFFVNVVFEQVL